MPLTCDVSPNSIVLDVTGDAPYILNLLKVLKYTFLQQMTVFSCFHVNIAV